MPLDQEMSIDSERNEFDFSDEDFGVDSDDSAIIYSAMPPKSKYQMQSSKPSAVNKVSAMSYTDNKVTANSKYAVKAVRVMSLKPAKKAATTSPQAGTNSELNSFEVPVADPQRLSLQQTLTEETSAKILPGARMEDEGSPSGEAGKTPEDTRIGFDGAAEYPSEGQEACEERSL